MKAARIHQFGKPEDLVLEDVPRPTPTADEVLVKVHAAGVNAVDLAIVSGAIRAYGFDPQLPHIAGSEVSGVIEVVGANVVGFRPGDAVVAVLGLPGGGYAEYVAVSPDLLAHKPAAVPHLDMAGVPIAGLAAWQALFEHGSLQRGQRVLVLAAAGGVGTFAVQFGRWAGAEVWGTTSTRNLDFVRLLGANPIDYTAGPFEDVVGEIDLVIDALGGEAQAQAWRTLKPTGTFISTDQ
jgi:NADPH:quinone reductase-like Zn-dependent oxidoreductase